MISPKEIKDKASRKYKDFLKYEIDLIFKKSTESFFPLIIRGDTGNVNDELFQRHKELQLLINQSKNTTKKGYSLELEKINSRKNGIQTDIKKIFIENKDDFLFLINEIESYNSFHSAINIIQRECNFSEQVLYNWLISHISDLCKIVEKTFWSDICICSNWFDIHLNSNLYIREIPVSVHTKFIENNKGLIKSLTNKADSELGFEDTFGLRSKPNLIRVRSLDNKLPIQVLNKEVQECSLTINDFNNIGETFCKDINSVFIVENEMVFLTFPEVDKSICIWGHGFTVTILKNVHWLASKAIYYFGDLDEHGFEILSSLRNLFTNVKSFCMTEKVLEEYKVFRVKGPQLLGGIIPKQLTKNELDVFMILRNGPHEENRLEQERIDTKTILSEIKLL